MVMIIITIVIIRYTRWWAGKLKDGSKPVIDQFRPKHSRFDPHWDRLLVTKSFSIRLWNPLCNTTWMAIGRDDDDEQADVWRALWGSRRRNNWTRLQRRVLQVFHLTMRMMMIIKWAPEESFVGLATHHHHFPLKFFVIQTVLFLKRHNQSHNI